MKISRRLFVGGSAGLGMMAPLAHAATGDALADGFLQPPDSAKPRVWWHWMNGNVTQSGIAQDLAWMKRVGIGGAQMFDASLSTPQIVEERLAFMSPGWKDAVRFAAQRSEALDLEFGVATSSGWSVTGGPWVEPQDAMKKVVWSETLVQGGARFNDVLPAPPQTSGPFQGQRRIAVERLLVIEPTLEEYYADIAVLAYPLAHAPLPAPRAASINGEAIDAARLNADIATGAPYPLGANGRPAYVRYDYARPQTVRSATVFAEALLTGGRTHLEASDDGRSWRAVAEIELRTVPTTVSFPDVRARSFRLAFAPAQAGGAANFGALSRGSPSGVDMAAVYPPSPNPPTPERLVQFELSSEARVHEFEAKAAFVIAEDYFALDHNRHEMAGVAPEQILDLTARVVDGRLDWTPPPGRWKVVRFGYSLTGRKNHPATNEGRGLEVDKFDAAAVEAYMRAYIGIYKDAAGDALVGRRGLRALITDSIEAERSNWTPSLFAQFQRMRGYDMRPWLPALVGVVVGSRARTDAFLYDFRRTLTDLYATEHYATIARIAHEAGLVVYGEAQEASRSTLGDDLDMRSYCDVPMSAFWTYGGEGPRESAFADGRGAASIAHLQGKSVVACEALTSRGQPWAQSPSDLQPMMDSIFLSGVTRPVIHTSVHQPLDRAPGLSLSVFGQFFTRHEAWAEMAGAWVTYMSRNCYLLQQGRSVADVAYFYGEDAPVGAQGREGGLTDTPKHNGYDFVSPNTVLTMLSVQDADVVSTGGARYKLLYLGEKSAQMTLPVLRKLHELAQAGAVIAGAAPRATPSLADDAAAFAQLVRQMWSGEATTHVGRGRVIANTDVEAVLTQLGIAPDFLSGAQAPASLGYVHRALPDGHIYYVSNRTAQPLRAEARFRVAGKAPQIWRAVCGAIEAVSYRQDGAHCVVPLDLLANESVFVVFRHAGPASAIVDLPAPRRLSDVTGEWRVSFQRGRGAPRAVQMATLASLSEHADAGVRYFSGVSTYTNTFTHEGGEQRVWLDLGRVGDVAEVRVNGRLAGTVWKAPYRLDVTSFVRAGRNRLEVRVANLWVNRLIGDQQPGAEKIAFTTIGTFTPNAPLRPSGLIGPVTLWVG